MRFYKFLCLPVILSLLLVPLLSLKGGGGQGGKSTKKPETESKQETVQLYLKDENKVVSLELSEYLVGVLAAEMPPTYHEQALKAQAVAAHTYLLHKQQEQKESPDPTLKGAALSDSSATHQGYLAPQQRKEKWGEKAESYEKKLSRAVEEVSGQVITFGSEPIIAAFHAINSGVTQSAQTVWGGEVEYLKSVASPGDKLSPDCEKTVAITAQEFSSAVLQLEGCELNGEAQSWLGKTELTDTGYVKSVEIGGGEFSGHRVREALDLRSAVFTVEYKNGSFYFSTCGYGHGVGMSQYGADYMARQGSTWQEIIKHYYSGVEIEKVSE